MPARLGLRPTTQHGCQAFAVPDIVGLCAASGTVLYFGPSTVLFLFLLFSPVRCICSSCRTRRGRQTNYAPADSWRLLHTVRVLRRARARDSRRQAASVTEGRRLGPNAPAKQPLFTPKRRAAMRPSYLRVPNFARLVGCFLGGTFALWYRTAYILRTMQHGEGAGNLPFLDRRLCHSLHVCRSSCSAERAEGEPFSPPAFHPSRSPDGLTHALFVGCLGPLLSHFGRHSPSTHYLRNVVVCAGCILGCTLSSPS